MKTLRFFVLTVLMLLFAVSAWATSPAAPVKHPAINAEEAVHTFDAVVDGQKVVHDFIIKNTGDAVLKIDRVDST